MQSLKLFSGISSQQGGPASVDIPAPVAYWKFDESSDGSAPVTRVDSYGSQDFTDNGNVRSGTGIINNGSDIEGSETRYLGIADNSTIDITGNLTIPVWFKPESIGNQMALISKWGASGTRSYYLRVDAAGTPRFLVTGNGVDAIQIASSVTLVPGTWYHIVGVYVPSTSLKIYVNAGTPDVNTTSIPSSIFNSSSALRAGARDDGADYLDGVLDESILAAKEYSAANISDLYGGGSPPSFNDITWT